MSKQSDGMILIFCRGAPRGEKMRKKCEFGGRILALEGESFYNVGIMPKARGAGSGKECGMGRQSDGFEDEREEEDGTDDELDYLIQSVSPFL